MLMKDKNRSMATVIVSKLKNRPQPLKDAPQTSGAEMADSDEMYTCVEEFLRALESRDIRGMKDALEAAFELYMNKHEASEPEMEMSEPSEPME